MARVFAVTASTDRLRLDASGRGEVSFTISNTEKRLLRSRVRVQPLGAARADWFSLAGEADRDLAPDATHQVTVRVAAPATAAGTFTFQLRVVSIDNPDEDWTDGPVTAFEAAGAAKPPNGKFPWWILLVVGAVVLIAGGVAAFIFLRPAGLNDPCKGDKCAAGLVCGPDGSCLGDAGYAGCKVNGDCVFGLCKDGTCGKPGLRMACPSGACDANLECVGGFCLGLAGFQGCKQSAECKVPPCIVPAAGGVGSCEGDRTTKPCSSNAQCSPNQICAADRGLCLRERDQPCEAPGQCASNVCQNGTCQSPGLGQPCQAGACGSGLRCVANVCLAAAGSACTSNPDCADSLCRGAVCTADATGMTCAAPTECSVNQSCVNGTCQRNTGQPCQAAGQCLSQICQAGACATLGEGQGCGAHVNCATGYCLGSQCFRPRNVGEACGSPEQCASRRCTNGSCAKSWIISRPDVMELQPHVFRRIPPGN